MISFLQVSGRVPGWLAAVLLWLLVYFFYSSLPKKAPNGKIGELHGQNDPRSTTRPPVAVKTETGHQSLKPQGAREKMCLCGGLWELIAAECVTIPSQTSRSVLVFAGVEYLLQMHVCVWGGCLSKNSFSAIICATKCYLSKHFKMMFSPSKIDAIIKKKCLNISSETTFNKCS